VLLDNDIRQVSERGSSGSSELSHRKRNKAHHVPTNIPSPSPQPHIDKTEDPRPSVNFPPRPSEGYKYFVLSICRILTASFPFHQSRSLPAIPVAKRTSLFRGCCMPSKAGSDLPRTHSLARRICRLRTERRNVTCSSTTSRGRNKSTRAVENLI
jgi:hypothetical protein